MKTAEELSQPLGSDLPEEVWRLAKRVGPLNLIDGSITAEEAENLLKSCEEDDQDFAKKIRERFAEL